MQKTGGAPEGGKRHPLNMRTTSEVRDKLEAAAAASGRSLVQEVEARIERSFAQDSAGGRLGQALAMAAQAVGEAASAHVEGHPSWTDDPWAYHQVVYALVDLMRRLAPKGPIVRPEPSDTLIEGLVEGGSTPEQARRLAEGIIDRGPSIHTVSYLTSQGRGEFYAGARAFQAKLGPKWAARLKKGESK